MNSPNAAPEPALLIIADISGYTRYMTANAKTLAHSQTLITELVESIIHQVEASLEVAKLEGDAIFLFCRKPKDAVRSADTRADISRKPLGFFQHFLKKLLRFGRSNSCTCHAARKLKS
jgi:class 3 adenylate cyclase